MTEQETWPPMESFGEHAEPPSDLTLVEVLDSYDGQPLLTRFRRASGMGCICVWVDLSPDKMTCRALLADATDEAIEAYLDGSKTLRDVMMGNETAVLVEHGGLLMSEEEPDRRARLVLVRDLPESYLPAEGSWA